jgi:glyoxylase-like metal-dependent hydrolase (beta-lactamase superfamily II)
LGKTAPDNTESDIVTILKDKYGIHKIPIASRMFGFVVNSYFVEKPCPTLVDVPPDEKVYLDKLQSGLGKVGYSISDVQRIIVTHPHFDHFGAARTITENSGAEIWASERGVPWFEDFEGELRSEEMQGHPACPQYKTYQASQGRGFFRALLACVYGYQCSWSYPMVYPSA